MRTDTQEKKGPQFSSVVSDDTLGMIPTEGIKGSLLMFGGAWLLKRFPKTTVLGLVAAGIYYGLSRRPSKKNRTSQPLH